MGVNLAFWGVAMLVNPVIRLLPTNSGEPAKIFELLVPLFLMMLAGGSSYLMKAAIGKTLDPTRTTARPRQAQPAQSYGPSRWSNSRHRRVD